MKSTINKEAEHKEKIVLPALMENIGSFKGAVVFFTDEKSGLLVFSPDKPGLSGTYAHNWVPCFDDDEWKLFKGEVTLSN